ncbi:3-methyl-2-oxobutanoate hydroxymethyltransferase [Campylobacterota bacterium]|nr:3-methyl-2-oxobutanoate hydroxymethyltransferase [Campylobacterota bacterium]
MNKTTILTIKAAKNRQKLTVFTAYDALFARLFADSADMLLVGDSLAMSFGGESDTLSTTIDEMIYHTKAVCKGAPESFVILDMPFGSFATEEIALHNALRVYRETKASAVKIEGGEAQVKIVQRLTQNGIAVLGHIGLLPQHARASGGFRVQGKDEEGAQQIVKDAKAIEAAGAFAIVLEGVKANAAGEITRSVGIPVIGIGAGRDVDGQVLVWSDMLGFFEAFKPKFVRRYFDGAAMARDVAARFAADVQSGAFPSEEEQY